VLVPVAALFLRKRSVPLLCGFASVILIYGAQLLWLGNRFPILFDRWNYRTGNALDYSSRAPVALGELLRLGLSHWNGYFLPVPGLHLGSDEWLIGSIVLVLASLPFLWGARARPDSRKILGAAWLLVVGVPLIQFALLRQHFAMHEYQAFKTSITVSLGWFALFSCFFYFRLNKIAQAAALILMIGLQTAHAHSSYLRVNEPRGSDYRDFSEYLLKAFPADRIFVSSEYEADWTVPQNLWYLKRGAYPPEVLNDYIRRGAVDLTGARLVYLSFQDPPRADPGYPCSSDWRRLEQPYFSKSGFACDVEMRPEMRKIRSISRKSPRLEATRFSSAKWTVLPDLRTAS
jgi:hypothetical protein